MNPEQWRRVRVLFDVVGQLPAHQRTAFLRHACAEEPDLRSEVESLLRAADGAGDFLEAPALQEATWPHPLAAAGAPPPRERIGPYQVLREIGRGGMGTVYLAQRAAGGFQQQVAIKLVRPGLSDELVRRFVAERQILAGLVHPYIARLYDGGTTEDGLPFFVMEHVEGEDLLTACDRRRLSTTERLRLFDKVCAAVQYAHQRLVVHRDLKPSNILVTADGSPKLLDFGVARLLQPDAPPEPGEAAVPSVLLMTPEYASPEQVRGAAVTTASDVYSLGVVLYELLTGHRPYRFASRRPEEVERVVCDTAPPRPSTVVGHAAEHTGPGGAAESVSPQTLSGNRGGTPERLRKSLAGDLDAIVLATLHKEPERRYASVEKLADDLRRHLAGQPVSVRADTFGYRAGRLVRRHVWASAATLAAILAIVVLVAFYTARLARERDRARLEAAKAQRVSAFLTNLFELSDLDRTKGVKLGVRDIVDRGARNLHRDLDAEPEVAAAMMSLIGGVYAQLDLKAEALPLFQEALATRRRLHGSDDPGTAAAERGLAGLYLELEQPLRAEPLLHHALAVEQKRRGAAAEVAATLTLLALVHKATGAYGEADAALARAASLQEQLGPPAELDLAVTLITSGHLLLSIDEPARALPLLRRGLEIRQRRMGRDSPGAIAALLDVGAAERETGQLDAAIAADQRVLAVSERDYGLQHTLPAYALGELAMAYGAKGEVTRARELYRRSIDTFSTLAGADSQPVQVYRRGLGLLLVAKGDPRAGLAELERVLASYERTLDAGHPRIGQALFDVAEARLALGETAGVAADMRRGLAIFRRELRPNSRRLEKALGSLGGLLCGRGEGAEGAPLLREAEGVLRRARPPQPGRLADIEKTLSSCPAGGPAPPRGAGAH